MVCGKWFDDKIPDLKPFTVPVHMTIDPFIGSAAVVEELIERSFRCIDRDSKTAGEDIQAFDMVAVLVRHQHRINLPGIKGRSRPSAGASLWCSVRIQKECSALSFKKNAIAFASAGQDRAAHRPIIRRSRIIVFNSSPFFGSGKKGSFNWYPEGHGWQWL